MNAALETPVHTIRSVNHHVSKASKRPSANPHEPAGRIHIHGITDEIGSETVLRDFFSKFGEIRDVCVPTHPSNGKPKGYAFVSFTKQADSGKVLDSLPIKINDVVVEVSQAKARENNHQRQSDNPRHNNRDRQRSNSSFSSTSYQEPQSHFGASGSATSMPLTAPPLPIATTTSSLREITYFFKVA